MQLQKKYKNTFAATSDIVKKYGIKRLYKGHIVNTAREILFLGTYFTVYEHCKTAFELYLPKFLAVPYAGGFSGSIGWLVSLPLDCVKANIQSSNLAKKSDSILTVLREIIKVKGVRGLYLGVVPSGRVLYVESLRLNYSSNTNTVKLKYHSINSSHVSFLVCPALVFKVSRAFLVSSSRFSAYEITMWMLSNGTSSA